MGLSSTDWLGVAALVISILTAIGSFYGWYQSKFRYSEVLAWSLNTIRTMQALYLRLEEQGAVNDSDLTAPKHHFANVFDLMVELSGLIENGRVFFKNSPGKGDLKGWGAEKPLAYQGIRPKLLDYLVAGFDAAKEWPLASESRRKDLLDVICEAERQFVSLVQHEVGRAKSSAVQTREQGKGSPLIWVLADLRAREAQVRHGNLGQ